LLRRPDNVLKDVGRLSGYGETTFQLKTRIADALNATSEEVNFELLLNALEELEAFAFFGGKSPLGGRPTMTAFAEVARRFGPLGDRYIVHIARRYVIERNKLDSMIRCSSDYTSSNASSE
jgi:nitrogenase molybdenum-iron protein alpha/beta subunit